MTKKPKKKTKMPRSKDETFERMKELTRRIISVPKSEIKARPPPKHAKGKRRR